MSVSLRNARCNCTVHSWPCFLTCKIRELSWLTSEIPSTSDISIVWQARHSKTAKEAYIELCLRFNYLLSLNNKNSNYQLFCLQPSYTQLVSPTLCVIKVFLCGVKNKLQAFCVLGKYSATELNPYPLDKRNCEEEIGLEEGSPLGSKAG
jgi:hypothetical protein